MEKMLGSGFKLAQGRCSAGKPSGREDRREPAFCKREEPYKGLSLPRRYTDALIDCGESVPVIVTGNFNALPFPGFVGSNDQRQYNPAFTAFDDTGINAYFPTRP